MFAEWVAEEFTSLDLGDNRLNWRAMQLVSQAAGIGDSNPDRCRSAGALKAHYRMTDNPKVNFASFLKITICPALIVAPTKRRSIFCKTPLKSVSPSLKRRLLAQAQ